MAAVRRITRLGMFAVLYAATGGWGFGQFSNGEPADEAQHKTCFACHEAHVKERDFIFTRFAQ
jgi:hypothetical protein